MEFLRPTSTLYRKNAVENSISTNARSQVFCKEKSMRYNISVMKRCLHSLTVAFHLLFVSAGIAGAEDPGAQYLGRSDHPRWSPDGKWIVFDSTRDGNYEIYIMRADGSGQKRLTQNPWQDLFPIFSADSKRIFFNSNREGWAPEPRRSQIYSMAIDGSDVINLTRMSYDWLDPNKAAANHMEPFRLGTERIGFLSDRGNGWHEIYSMDANGDNISRLTYDRRHHYNLHASPDGQWIYFDGHLGGHSTFLGDGGWDFYRIPSTGGNWESVLDRDDLETYDGAFSPDGSILLFHVAGKSGLWRWRMGDDPKSAEIMLNESAFSVRWSPDAEKIAFVSERDGHREIYVSSPEGANAERLTKSQ